MAEINFNINTEGSTSFAPGGGNAKPEIFGELGTYTENGEIVMTPPPGFVWSGVHFTLDYNLDDIYSALYNTINPPVVGI